MSDELEQAAQVVVDAYNEGVGQKCDDAIAHLSHALVSRDREEPPRVGTDILVFDDLSHETITFSARVKKGVWTVVANKRGYIVVRMPGLDSAGVRAYSNDLDYVTKALNS